MIVQIIMSTSSTIKIFFFVSILFVASVATNAQDSTKKKTINITSTFKPVLREAVKINFTAAPPAIDSSTPRLAYSIPQHQLYFNYQPVALSPVALQVDSIAAWQNSNYVKVGVGNVHLPFIQAGFSFGDGKSTFLNVFAQHYNSKGSLDFQKNTLSQVMATGTLKTKSNLEWTAKLGYKIEDCFLYGYQPKTLPFGKDQLKEKYQTFNTGIALRNMEANTYGISYNPSLNINMFSGETNNVKATESNTVLNLPLEKSIGKLLGIKLGFTADMTRYNPAVKNDIVNNVYTVPASLFFKSPNFYMQTGVIPSWDNKVFTLLPNFMADITTKDKRFTIQAGWIGYYEKGSYQRYANLNPWIAQPTSLLNTRVREIYGGFKGSLANHFIYSAKVAYNRYHNMPLFVNDTTDGKTFTTLYSPTLDAIQIHGEIGYNKGEDFSARAGLTVNQFSKVQGQEKAWGLLPVELNAGLRWQVIKDLYVKTDMYVFDGAEYRTINKEARKGSGGFDMNVGAEFKIARNLNLWLQMNNLFNNKYERWNQYQVYGFNILGGVVFSFNHK